MFNKNATKICLCVLDKGIEKNAKEENKNNVKETERIVSDDDPEEEGCGERARYCTF